MTIIPPQRNVTIMFTDIVGYSAMIGKNESHALELLDEHNQTIEPTIKSKNGRIIKHIGDAPVEILGFSMPDTKKWPISKIEKKHILAEISAQYFVKTNFPYSLSDIAFSKYLKKSIYFTPLKPSSLKSLSILLI